MKKFFCTALGTVATVVAIAACAQSQADDFYLGVAVSPAYSGKLDTQINGKTTHIDSNKSETPLKLFGGYRITSAWGVEAGYQGAVGAIKFDAPAGSQVNLSEKLTSAYVAASGTMALSADWSLIGKLGVARVNVKSALSGPELQTDQVSRTIHKNSLYASVGAAYAITQNLSVQLELENLGKVRDEGLIYNANRFSLGLRYGF